MTQYLKLSALLAPRPLPERESVPPVRQEPVGRGADEPSPQGARREPMAATRPTPPEIL
ncbi:hypothetical protein SAMN05444002_0616 [Vannielia litorea]|uniref:Uncharacterized protein n=1 Tax=Vannielia litorea TaxID=1217970 RepID=A0A1N6ED16_9RHOB|nr:hypothetical protein SAMN05444002_0616 [Vannielia litorea]